MKLKNVITMALASAMLITTVACGSSSGGSSQPSNGTSGSKTEESAAGGEETAAGDSDTADEAFGQKDPASYNAHLKFMVHSTGQPEYMIKKFNEIYPNIEIELIVVPGGEQQEKIVTTVAAGEDVPDMFTCRTQFVKAIVNSDKYYLDLNQAPYNAGEWTSDIEDYVVGVGTDTTGALRALSWQCPVGGVYYRKSLAREIFGTDDPAEMAEHFSSFDKILETAATIKEKTGGKVKFSADTLSDILYMGTNHSGGYVTPDNKLNINDDTIKMFEVAKTMYDEDYSAKIRNDMSAVTALGLEDGFFCMCYPTWGLNYNIMPNFPDQAGDWALTTGPYPFTAGGTYIGIYEGTPYKEECYLFLKYILSDEEFVRSYATDFGDYVSNKKIQQEVGSYTAEQAEGLNIFTYLDGQNAYAYWNGELARGIDPSIFSADDEYAGSYLGTALEAYATGSKSLEDALATYKDDMANYDPTLIIE